MEETGFHLLELVSCILKQLTHDVNGIYDVRDSILLFERNRVRIGDKEVEF